MDAWQDVPKVELHVHLEGAMPHAALWALLQKYGGDPQVPDVAALTQKFVYRDFPHFIDTWTWMIGYLREYEDFEYIAAEVARDFVRQNILYVELIYSAADFLVSGLEPQRLTASIRAGLQQVPGVQVALVADLVRDYGAARAQRMLECLREVKNLGVVGVNIGGREHRVPPDEFKDVFEQAREWGFHTSAHAGEAAGPASIWGALNVLRVERIGHGTRAVEDPRLVDYLAEHQIPLELCIVSNVRTGVITDATQHPVRLFFDRGIPLSINTDDPSLFGNSLAHEYATLQRQLGFTRDEVLTLIRQGVTTSWLADDNKRALLSRLE